MIAKPKMYLHKVLVSRLLPFKFDNAEIKNIVWHKPEVKYYFHIQNIILNILKSDIGLIKFI